MPYTKSTQKKYGENPLKKKTSVHKKSSGFKMKSPYKMFGAFGSLMGRKAPATGGEGNEGTGRRRILGGSLGRFGNIF